MDDCHCDEDYLQDPSMWVDLLPQPFRLVDELVVGVLAGAWEAIEVLEARRAAERRRVKLPEYCDACLVAGVESVRCVCSGRDGVVIVGCGDGITVLEGGGEGQRLVAHADGGEVLALSVGWCRSEGGGLMHLVAAVGGSGVLKVYALTHDQLVLLAEINDGSSSQAKEATLAPSCSHLAVSVVGSEGGHCSVEVYSLPHEAWNSELDRKISAEQQRQEEEGGSKTSLASNQEVTFSKPSLLFTLPPLKSTSLSLATDPAQMLNSITSSLLGGMASGELHMLTQQYLESRRKAFVSSRPHFVSQQSPDHSIERQPVYHFLYYKGGQRKGTPSYLTVRWEGLTQLYIYALEPPNKGSSLVAHRLYPQASAITASAVCPQGRLMALGLQSGVVVVWDQKTGLCKCVVLVSSRGGGEGSVSALLFLQSSELVVVGTVGGEVCAISCTTPPHQLVSLNKRGYECTSAVVDMSEVTANVVCSLHLNGTAIVWDLLESTPLCLLKLSNDLTVTKCSFTTSYAILTGAPPSSREDDETPPANLFSLSLPSFLPSSSSKAQSTAMQQHKEPTNFVQTLEAKLMEAIRLNHHIIAS